MRALISVLAAVTLVLALQGQTTTPAGKENLLEGIDRVMATVERLRGLPFKYGLDKRLCTRKELADYADTKKKKRRIESLHRREQALKLLGLLPQDFDLEGAIDREYVGRIGGFYDPEKNLLVLRSDLAEGPLGKYIMAHELTHALDDQYYDLERLRATARTDSDREFAVSALFEGSATILQQRYMLGARLKDGMQPNAMGPPGGGKGGRPGLLCSSPPCLAAAVLPKYTLSVYFLSKGRLYLAMMGCREALAEAVRDLPASSEQILHPEKYWDREHRDHPVRVLLPSADELVGPGWSLTDRDTLGEINCALLARSPAFRFRPAQMVMASTPLLWTNEAATGWGGDAFGLYRSAHGEKVLVWCSTWDSRRDAEEFYRAFQIHRGDLAGATAFRGRVIVAVFGAEQKSAEQIAGRALGRVRFRQPVDWRPGQKENGEAGTCRTVPRSL